MRELSFKQVSQFVHYMEITFDRSTDQVMGNLSYLAYEVTHKVDEQFLLLDRIKTVMKLMDHYLSEYNDSIKNHINLDSIIESLTGEEMKDMATYGILSGRNERVLQMTYFQFCRKVVDDYITSLLK